MLSKLLTQRAQRKKLTQQLEMLKTRKSSLIGQLKRTQQGNQGNARRSDRKFKENSGKALSARAKRSNKSVLLELDRQIKFTQAKINRLDAIEKKEKLTK